MSNKDAKLIENAISYATLKLADYIECIQKSNEKIDLSAVEHPLDTQIVEILKDLKSNIRDDDNDYYIFKHLDTVKNIWKSIIEKSIKCLRYFDTREPFINNPDKHPIAYGVNELCEYFDKYSSFESMLYGGGKYYRDHIVHVFRVWLLGINCLLDNDAAYLKKIKINDHIKINNLEKISIWSIIALTHDLGYPLEKSQEIIDKTKDMMKSFVANPILSVDLSFNGVQNNMNDFITRFISSKMHKLPNKDTEELQFGNMYVVRLQPKYYFKFQKSLEQCKHGILSSIIIYKLLIYFLESDFNINEDYQFDEEDARQFYIRREILRSIASHTCHDVYHLDMLSFSYLLIVVDDSQEWGRKRLSELYVGSNFKYEFIGITSKFDTSKTNQDISVHECSIDEQFEFEKYDALGVVEILKSLRSQYENYKELFRDGQDTSKRNFTFRKKCEIILKIDRKPTLSVEITISNEKPSEFKIIVSSTDIKRDKDDILKNILDDQYLKFKLVETQSNNINNQLEYILSESDNDE